MEKDNKTIIISKTYINGNLINETKESKEIKWKCLECDSVYQAMLKKIGIGNIQDMYINTNEIQDREYEYTKIIKFIQKYMEKYAKENNLNIEDLKLEFINYGKTELVYVLEEPNGRRVTLLVKQPAIRLGDVYKEYENLLELKKKDKNVVAPIDYYEFGDQELYVTPYINQARCIASYGTWGMYVPEPYYRFEGFNKEAEKVVTISMIAKLVSLYNLEKEAGISKCKLGGGDFMLPKGWEKDPLTIENIFNKLYLIAARDKINCSLEEYLNIIRDEFRRSTIGEKEENLKLNIRGRVPIKDEYIEKGIELGKKLIKVNGNEYQKTM